MEAREHLTVLVVNAGLHSDVDEYGEVRELVTGLLEAEPARVTLLGTDCKSAYLGELNDGHLVFRRLGSIMCLRNMDIDVVHVHLVIPATQLLAGLLARVRRIPVLLTPMSMLGQDFARSSWFLPRPKPYRLMKPAAVRLLAACWRMIAQTFVCASAEEVRQALLPPERCVLLPLAAPNSDLSVRARSEAGHRTVDRNDGPLAVVSRFDPHRKGLDRIARWLRAYDSALPRPAVRLLAPRPVRHDPLLDDLVADGLVEWLPDVRGAALTEALSTCRGVMLLSRWDGQPRVLREAALLGLPTLSTRASHFAEMVEVLGSGVVVDGDDVQAVQDGFVSLPHAPQQSERAHAVLDRTKIGAYLWRALAAAATGARVEPASYYDVAAAELDSGRRRL